MGKILKTNRDTSPRRFLGEFKKRKGKEVREMDRMSPAFYFMLRLLSFSKLRMVKRWKAFFSSLLINNKS